MLIEPVRIFIGYDSKEPVAYHVLAHSILKRASCPVSITPLVQSTLRDIGVYTRERGATESTEFSMTRFLVPFLSGYEGTSIFLDCDMLCQADIAELAALADWRTRPSVDGVLSPRRAVHVCQHEYTPTATVKFLGQVNVPYPRKNWSSVMVFDNWRCRRLTPERVNILSGLELHRFSWLRDDEVGALPLEWNWLVGEYEPNPHAKLLHYTLGGPWFRETSACDHHEAWRAEYETMMHPMGEVQRFERAMREHDVELAYLAGQVERAGK